MYYKNMRFKSYQVYFFLPSVLTKSLIKQYIYLYFVVSYEKMIIFANKRKNSFVGRGILPV